MLKLMAAFWRPTAGFHLPLLDDVAVRGLVLNLVCADQGRYGGPGRDPMDALVSVWADAQEVFRVLVGRGERVWGWVVEEHRPRRYERAWPDGEPSPGVKLVALARRRAGSTHREFADHWVHRHAPLALRHHEGLWSYTQNVVVEPLTADAEAVDGIAELHFATRQDFEQRFYDSPAGQQMIAEDVAHFLIGPGPDTTLMSETIVRSPLL